MYHIKHSVFGVPLKCAGVGVAKFSENTHVRCGSVQSEKLLCAECAVVPKFAAPKYSAILPHRRYVNRIFSLHCIVHNSLLVLTELVRQS